MKEKEDRAAAVILPAANDNGPPGGAAGAAVDRHIRTIARAIGRHIAREQIRAWAQERRQQAANDNGQE